MNRRTYVGIPIVVLALLLNLLAPAAWAQSAAPRPHEEVTETQRVAAGFASVVYVPCKLGFCIVSGVSWFAVLALSGGTAYNTATDFVRAGCGGDWVVHGEDIKFRSSHPYGDGVRSAAR
jgi:hypothetical protein